MEKTFSDQDLKRVALFADHKLLRHVGVRFLIHRNKEHIYQIIVFLLALGLVDFYEVLEGAIVVACVGVHANNSRGLIPERHENEFVEVHCEDGGLIVEG
jgi:hypothetical protein